MLFKQSPAIVLVNRVALIDLIPQTDFLKAGSSTLGGFIPLNLSVVAISVCLVFLVDWQCSLIVSLGASELFLVQVDEVILHDIQLVQVLESGDALTLGSLFFLLIFAEFLAVCIIDGLTPQITDVLF